jgi:hypothetical protein
MHEQTIWLAPRATGFTEICEACEEEHPIPRGATHAVVQGTLRLEADGGWVSCPRGHAIRVLRMSASMPAGALR